MWDCNVWYLVSKGFLKGRVSFARKWRTQKRIQQPQWNWVFTGLAHQWTGSRHWIIILNGLISHFMTLKSIFNRGKVSFSSKFLEIMGFRLNSWEPFLWNSFCEALLIWNFFGSTWRKSRVFVKFKDLAVLAKKCSCLSCSCCKSEGKVDKVSQFFLLGRKFSFDFGFGKPVTSCNAHEKEYSVCDTLVLARGLILPI